MKFLWQQIPSPIISEILCQNSFDGIVIDTEHGGYNTETLSNCIQVITLNKKKCFVRLTEVNKTLIRQCLDAGCDGLIFSTIENVKQVNLVKEYSLNDYHQEKCRLLRNNKHLLTILTMCSHF